MRTGPVVVLWCASLCSLGAAENWVTVGTAHAESVNGPATCILDVALDVDTGYTGPEVRFRHRWASNTRQAGWGEWWSIGADEWWPPNTTEPTVANNVKWVEFIHSSGFGPSSYGPTYDGPYLTAVGNWIGIRARAGTAVQYTKWQASKTVPGAAATLFHHVRFTNYSAVPVTFTVMKGSVVLDTVSVPALTFDMVRTYSYLEGESISVTSGKLTDYAFQDGAWIALAGNEHLFTPVKDDGSAYEAAWWNLAATNPTLALGAVSGSSPPAPVASTPSNSIDVNTPTVGTSGNPALPTSVPAPGGSGVWVNTTGTTDTERLDKSTYRVGVDKQVAEASKQLTELKSIKEAITGTANVSAAGFATTGNMTAFATANQTAQGSMVNGVVTGLPALPDVFPSNISKTSTFTFALAFPYVGNKTISVNMSEHAEQVLWIRGMFKAIFAVWFFFIEVVTVRKAFAG